MNFALNLAPGGEQNDPVDKIDGDREVEIVVIMHNPRLSERGREGGGFCGDPDLVLNLKPFALKCEENPTRNRIFLEIRSENEVE